MIVEQPEAFKTWLTAVLKPMCEADPAALAKYVIALIKKDKADDELRKSMIGQLEVFLEEETEGFVNLVFQTLHSQEYIRTPVIPSANPPNPNIVKKDKDNSAKDKVIVQPSELPNLSEQINGATNKRDTESKRDREVRDNRKGENEKDEKSQRGSGRRRDRTPSRDRTLARSRSRSWDRSKQRSRSRDRSPAARERSPPPHRGGGSSSGGVTGGSDKRGGTERSQRGAWRNKSPPPSRSSRYDRRRSRTPPSPAGGRSGRSRSPRSPRYQHGRGGRYRNNRSVDRSRSRSRSLDNKPRRDSLKDKDRDLSRPSTPTQDSNHGDSDLRLGAAQSAISSAKRRCRDFDEKGYCMRGEMCPFDHGVDPVVLEDAALSRVLSYNPNGGAAGGPTDVAAPVVAALGPPNAAALSHPMMGVGGGAPGPRGVIPSEYNPQAPFLRGFRGPRPLGPARLPSALGMFPPQPNMNRELIPVPVMDNKQNAYTPGGGAGSGGYPPHSNYVGAPMDNHHHNNHHHNHDGGGGGANMFYPPHHNMPPHHHHHGGHQLHPHQMQHNQKKMGANNGNKFDYNRLGPRAPKNPANCSLELKKIPAGLNSITHLNNHFGKFGKITNIQVNYEGDTEAAIVTFSSHAEASAAYRSTEAVLNNRFIKVFWHNSNNDGKQENVPPRPVKERLGQSQVVAPNTNKVLNLVQPKAFQSDDSALAPPGSEGAIVDVKGAESDDLGANNPSKNLPNKEETKAQANAAIKKNQELLAAKEKLKKNQDEQRKEVLKIKQDLRKRKQELLEKQLSQQKILIEKMEKLPQGPQRDLVKETIKKTQESIEEIRKDIAHSALAIKAAVTQKKTREDAQKELLDLELEIMSKQQEGADVSEIQRRYYELKARSASVRLGARGVGARGMGAVGLGLNRRFNPMQRNLLTKNNLLDGSAIKSSTKIDRTGGVGSNNNNNNVATALTTPTGNFVKPGGAQHSVDHRPTRILVSGYEIEEQDSVIAHFQQFGEIADYVSDSALPSLTFNFKVRKDAEAALLKGKHFQDRTLSITWCSTAQLNNQMSNSRTTRKVLMSESEEEQLIDQSILDGDEDINAIGQELSEEVLLQDDDEDDDEERSWRR